MKNYTFEIRFIQMFVFPPWSIFKTVFSEQLMQHKNTAIFLLLWSTLQWILLISMGTNMIATIFSSNIAILLFYSLNIYVCIDMSLFSEKEKERLYSMPLKLLVTATSFFIMYSIPHITTKIYSHAFPNKIEWSSFHIIVNAILAIAWFAFMLINKYKVFELFPKTEFKEGMYRLVPLTDEKIYKIYFGYMILIGSFLFYRYLL